jgi:hypothetical protein
VVSRVGKWDTNPPGIVTFSLSIANAGQYAMTVYYVLTNNTSRQVQITVTNSSSSTQTVTFLDSERTGSPPGCVDPQPVILVNLGQGTNTIRFANPADRAPTLDRIVISKP